MLETELNSCRKAFNWIAPDEIDTFRNFEKGSRGLPKALTETYGYTSAPSILLSIMTITLNIFVIRFYRKTELTVVSLLYTLIAVMDIVCAVGTIYQYITLGLCVYADVGAGKPFDVNTMIFLFLIQVSYRCSVFCNLVLAVSRTIMIVKPFYEINKKAVGLVCILNVLPWIVLYGMNLYVYLVVLPGDDLYFELSLDVHKFMIGYGLQEIVASHILYLRALGLDVMYLLPDLIVFMIPVIIVIITCIIQIISIWRSSQFPNRANQRHVTITVLFMSTLFVICNTPLCVYILILMHGLEKNVTTQFVLCISFATLLPLVNGALNPVIIISRSSEMKRKFWNILQRMRCWVRAEQE